jgi:hypothetical protein
MDHSTHLTGLPPAVAMGLSGFVLAAVVPGVVRLTRRFALWRWASLPAGVALPLLVVVHAWAVLGDPAGPLPTAGARLTEPVLLVSGVLFWIPVLTRTRHRLSDPGRCLYLFLAMPLLDLPAVWVVAEGRPAEGIAMIVGMLPLGIAAAAVTWSWVNREERLAADDLALSPGDAPHAP